MKALVRWWVIRLCLLPFLSSASFADVVIVKHGVAKTAIVVTLEAMTNHPLVSASVNDLCRCIEKMSGAKVEIVTNGPTQLSDRLPILVGELAERTFGPPAKKSLEKQGWRLVVSEKGIGLIGESDKAVSYAVYELLDRLGCRWCLPGDMGEVIPERKTIQLPPLDISATPDLIWRGIWYCDSDFIRRNRLGSRSEELAAAQGLEGYLSAEQLTAHPDWNAEMGGKRSMNGRYCWGNPEAAQAIADNIIAALDKKYVPSWTLSPGDGIAFCECAKCKALDTGDWDPSMNCVSLSDRLVHFCNQIVERVNKKYPDVKFGMLAYVQYTRPPLREKPVANLIPELSPITYCRAHSMLNTNCPSRHSLLPIVEGWAKVAPQLSLYQFGYNLAEVSAPYPLMTQWGEELPIFFANHVKYWQPETMPNFASSLPGLYLGVRLSWHTTAKPQDILNEFFDAFYGAAAKAMRQYWRTMDDAWTLVPAHAGCGFEYLRRFTPETMKAARVALDKAAAACRTDMEKRRVKLADESFSEFELFMKMRRDLAAGHMTKLEADGQSWLQTWDRLTKQYAAQYAFSPYGSGYFGEFFFPAYKDGTRIATNFVVMPPISEWKYVVDKDKKGESRGYSKAAYDDESWKTTNPAVETWSDLGLGYDCYGAVWYRASVKIPAISSGKKVYLWISATDGSAKVFVNGQHIPFVDDKGKTNDVFSGYCVPASFEITAAIKQGAENQIAIMGTHDVLNEIGTGGLIGPVVIYHDRP